MLFVQMVSPYRRQFFYSKLFGKDILKFVCYLIIMKFVCYLIMNFVCYLIIMKFVCYLIIM